MTERIFRVMRGDGILYEAHIDAGDDITTSYDVTKDDDSPQIIDTVTIGEYSPPEVAVEEVESADTDKRKRARQEHPSAAEGAFPEGDAVSEPHTETTKKPEPPEPKKFEPKKPEAKKTEPLTGLHTTQPKPAAKPATKTPAKPFLKNPLPKKKAKK